MAATNASRVGFLYCLFRLLYPIDSLLYAAALSKKNHHILFKVKTSIASLLFTLRSRKSGPVVFSRSREIWADGICIGPENLDQLYFHLPRKCGSVINSRFQKIWGCGVSRFQKIWGSVIFNFPENLVEQSFFLPRKHGHHHSSQTVDKTFAVESSGVVKAPDNRDF